MANIAIGRDPTFTSTCVILYTAILICTCVLCVSCAPRPYQEYDASRMTAKFTDRAHTAVLEAARRCDYGNNGYACSEVATALLADGNTNHAIALFFRACELGHVPSCTQVSQLYPDWEGVAVQYAQVAMEKAAEEAKQAETRRRAERAAQVERICAERAAEVRRQEANRLALARAQRDAEVSRASAEVEIRNAAARDVETRMREWIEKAAIVKKLPCSTDRSGWYILALQVTNRSKVSMACAFGQNPMGIVLGEVDPKQRKTIRPGQSARFTSQWGSCTGSQRALFGSIYTSLTCQVIEAHREEAGVEDNRYSWFGYDYDSLRMFMPRAFQEQYRPPPLVQEPSVPPESVAMVQCRIEAAQHDAEASEKH